jgi:hypothetical protein
MKYFWITVIATVSFGLIVDPAITMAVVATIVFGLLTIMPLLTEDYTFK